MSDADSFIQEVSDEVRRDRLFRLWRRYGPAVVGALVAVVIATAVLEWRKHAAAESARASGAALLEASRADGAAGQAAAFADLSDALEGGAATLALLRRAGALVESGSLSEALSIYAAVSEDAAVDPTLSDFAAWRAAALTAATADATAGAAALEPIARGDGPFRLLALEALAAARIASNDVERARADLDAVLSDPSATEVMRLRVQEVLAALGPAAEPASPDTTN